MKINEIISPELLERYYYKRRRPLVTRRPVVKSRGRVTNPIQKKVSQPTRIISPRLTQGVNPKVDIMNAPNFKLDNHNVFPEILPK